MWGFTITLGYSRRMWAQAALDQKLGTLLRMHEAAFREWGAVPEEILYDRMKTVWMGTDERGEIVWNAVFLDFARYWGFRPRLCRPYRAQTKGKIESGVKYVRRNFLCGLLGREPACLMDFNAELRAWVDGVANQRVHGTTQEQVLARWDMDQFSMQLLNGRPPYPYLDDELRKVARDAYVSWQASRYSVPWQYAGKEVWVREHGVDVEVHYGGERIADACPAPSAATRSSRSPTTSRRHSAGQRENRWQDADSDAGNARRRWKCVRWPPTKAWRWEVRYDSHRTAANFAHQPGPEGSRCSPGEPAGKAAKKEPGYAEFLVEVMSCEADARRSAT